MRPARPLIALAPPALVGVAAAVAAAVPSEVPRPRFTMDSAAPLFAADDLVPGARRSACALVRNAGDAPGQPALYAGGSRGALAPYLRLTVTRGRTCGEPDPQPLAPGLAPGVVYDGSLASFPRTLASALADPAVWRAGERRAYRFDLELGDDPAAAGLSATWDWRLGVEASTGASSRSLTGCERVQLAGAARGSTSRTLMRTARFGKGVRAVLVLRVLGSASAPRVVLTTGLRVRDGRTLLVPGWARVRYRVNGRVAATARTRPFRVRIPASGFRPGRSRVSVAVQPRRGARRTASFTLRATRATIGGRPVCVLGA